jgi:hypothetical protein
MTVVCAWCGTFQCRIEPLDDPRVSHGICLECYKRAFPSLPIPDPPPETPSE